MAYDNDKVSYLRSLLRKHGFHEAASRLDITGVNLDRAIKMWETYPMCLNRFPQQLTKKDYRGMIIQ